MSSPALANEPERDVLLSHIEPAAALRGFDEQFNPYSGQFVVRFLTASLPGKGGLDVNVWFYYSSEVWNRTDSSQTLFHSASIDTTDHLGGSGWQLHMGKVINADGTGSPFVTTPDNPRVVMPDGSTRLLYQSSAYPGEFISEDRWRYRFDPSIPGWELTATDGTVYLFQTVNNAGATSMTGSTIAQCTRITDVYGNVVAINYVGFGLIDEIIDTHGRRVEFTYYSGTDRIQYVRVKNGATTLQQWEFRYTSALLTWTHFFISRTVYAPDEVIPPVGNRWRFTTNSASIPKRDGAAMLSRIELPTGGIIDYDYGGEDFEVGCFTGVDIERAVLKQRQVSGRAVVPATYNYAYSNPGQSNATTSIAGPLGYFETYNLIGFGSYTSNDTNLFQIGRVTTKTVQDGSQTTQEQFSWVEGDVLSNDNRLTSAWENCVSSRFLSPVRFVKPQSVVRTVSRGGSSWVTTTSNFDQYGNPLFISEQGELTRSTTLAYWYSPSNNLIEGRTTLVKQSPGTRERRWYDALGRLERQNLNPTSSAHTNGIDTTFAYDATGQLTQTVTENGSLDRETRFNSYAFGVPQQDVLENTGTGLPDILINRSINARSLVDWQEDGRTGTAFRTHFTYDNLGRVTLIDPPAGASTTIAYATDGSTATSTRGTGVSAYSQRYSFDGFGRLTRWEDLKRGDRRELVYDALERLIEERFYRGGNLADRHFYDGLGRLTEVRHSDNTAIRFAHSGNTVTATDEEGDTTTFVYHSFGNPDEQRLSQLQDAESSVWNYSYDAAKGLLSLIDAPQAGADRSFAYTSRFLLASENHPEFAGAVTYQYSPAGDRIVRQRGGIFVGFVHDRIGRLRTIDTLGYDVGLSYVGVNLVAGVSNGSASHAMSYDGAQRLGSRTTFGLGPLIQQRTDYSYDGHDRVTQINYPTGRLVRYSYNPKGQLIKVFEIGRDDYLSSVTYTGAGDVSTMTYGNGASTSYLYDSRFRPTLIDAGSRSISLDYYADSSLKTWTADGQARSFGYDRLGRLTTATGPSGETLSYQYSATGDRQLRTVDGVTETYSYNSSQQLTSVSGAVPATYGYDNSGRLTSANGRAFTYTPLDQLATVSGPSRSYTYDGDGYRVSRTDASGTTYFLRDSSGQVLAEFDGSGTLLREHVYALGRRVATVFPDRSRFYFQHDAQGSAWIVTDDTGAEVQPPHLYWPFGLPEGPTASSSSAAAERGKRRRESRSAALRVTTDATTPAGKTLIPERGSTLIFADGFETGCRVSWSGAVPYTPTNDGMVIAPEECDDLCLAGETCESLGYDGGTLACDRFRFDTSGCRLCGDGEAEPPEQCDGGDLAGQTCESLGFAGGALGCTSSCTFNTSGCHSCGNGVINVPGEECDGADLGGQTCQSRGFDGGTLACSPDCLFDTSGCRLCGNGVIEPPEVCEGADLGGETCQTQGFDEGTLACLPDCLGFDTSACENYPDDPSAQARFTGREFEPDLDLYYLGARYLDAFPGRFTVPDPGPFRLDNPQSFNRYAYASNNPYKYDDPNGRVVDTVLDAGFIAYDLFDIGRSLVRGQGVSGGQVAALGGDVAGFFIPFATGLGRAAKGLLKASDEVGTMATTAARSGRAKLLRANRAVGRAAEARIAARFAGSRPKGFRTSRGNRFIDVFSVGRLAIESKVGRTSLTEGVRRQVLKDAELLSEGQVAAVEWWFSRSPTTGRVGPTAPLKALLDEKGISIKIEGVDF